jgi:hypothetical protein
LFLIVTNKVNYKDYLKKNEEFTYLNN